MLVASNQYVRVVNHNLTGTNFKTLQNENKHQTMTVYTKWRCMHGTHFVQFGQTVTVSGMKLLEF